MLNPQNKAVNNASRIPTVNLLDRIESAGLGAFRGARDRQITPKTTKQLPTNSVQLTPDLSSIHSKNSVVNGWMLPTAEACDAPISLMATRNRVSPMQTPTIIEPNTAAHSCAGTCRNAVSGSSNGSITQKRSVPVAQRATFASNSGIFCDCVWRTRLLPAHNRAPERAESSPKEKEKSVFVVTLRDHRL